MVLEVMEKRGQVGEHKSAACVKDSTWRGGKGKCIEHEDHESITIPHSLCHDAGDTGVGLEQKMSSGYLVICGIRMVFTLLMLFHWLRA